MQSKIIRHEETRNATHENKRRFVEQCQIAQYMGKVSEGAERMEKNIYKEIMPNNVLKFDERHQLINTRS